MARLLSGRVKVTPPTGVTTDRYQYLSLEQAEPNAGVPSSDGFVLASDTNGNRFWRSAPGASAINGITIKDEGSVVGTASSVDSINFVGGNVTATASGVGATITVSDTPTFTSLAVSGIGTINGLTYPTSDGSDGQVLKTNGLGVLTFVDQTAPSSVRHILPVLTRTAQANTLNDATMVTVYAGINTVIGRFGSDVNVTQNAFVPFRETVGITTQSLIETFFNTSVA